jgi:hypothetical protein
MMGRSSSPNRGRSKRTAGRLDGATKLHFAKPIRPAETTNLKRHLPDDQTPSAAVNIPETAATDEQLNVQL